MCSLSLKLTVFISRQMQPHNILNASLNEFTAYPVDSNTKSYKTIIWVNKFQNGSTFTSDPCTFIIKCSVFDRSICSWANAPYYYLSNMTRADSYKFFLGNGVLQSSFPLLPPTYPTSRQEIPSIFNETPSRDS